MSFYSDSDNIVPDQCACCLQNVFYELMQCHSCKKKYHDHCHMPMLPEYPTSPHWSCTMCNDREFFDALKLMRSTNLGVSNGEPGRTVIEHIIMTLSSKNDNIHFREYPSMKTFPKFFDTISNPIHIAIINNRLESNLHYITIDQVIDDLRKVFTDSLKFYDKTHRFYGYARNLLDLLERMVSKWIPELETKISESSS
ncbi:tripartite motif-containing protein 66-like [Melanaphis sacchari]|uniref:Tripartite motif-containing protein 66 n=1 Tax=Melanaphis sacchari TaxID=742174 RepID=A0A2H8TKM2_9HEMI|nr:tripartite motif-containing protein 66-like [Melanaphis sacchari]